MLYCCAAALALFVAGQAGAAPESADPQARRMLGEIEAKLKADPGNPRLLAARGIVLGQTGREAEALRSLDAALKISPKFLLALEGAAEIAYRTRDPRAKSYLERVFAQDPKNAVAHGMAGALAFEGRDCGGAVRHFEAAGAAAERNPLALAQWGECSLELDRAGQAADLLGRSLALRPGDNIVGWNLALALRLAGREAEAQTVVSTLPDSAEKFSLIGQILLAQDKLQDAIAALRRAIELDPKDERHYVELASICLDHDAYDLAEEIVKAGLANIPQSAELFTLRGAIAAQLSKPEEASADFERARRLRPDSGYGDVGLTLLLRDQDQIERAIQVIRPRWAADRNNASLNYLLADLLIRRATEAGVRPDAQAMELLERAVRLDPGMAKAHATLGKVLTQSGDTERGVRELRKALDLDPADRVAMNQLVLALGQLGRKDEAAAAAAKLRDALAADRKAEVKKNSVRLVRLSPPER